jgi:hypothetical protein
MRQSNLFPFRRNPPDKPLAPRKLRDNIRRVYRLAHELERKHGIGWYREASQIAGEISRAYNVNRTLVAHVIAALSPNNDWRRNVLDARAIFAEVFDYIPSRYSTYGANVAKARAMIVAYRNREDWHHILRGNKVTSFASNIDKPSVPARVTVDFHALSVAHAYRYTTKTCPTISDKLYEQVSAAYIAVAQEYNLLPQQLQAVVWLTWKRIYRV